MEKITKGKFPFFSAAVRSPKQLSSDLANVEQFMKGVREAKKVESKLSKFRLRRSLGAGIGAGIGALALGFGIPYLVNWAKKKI